MTTIAPPRPDIAELEELVSDPPAKVCHLVDTDATHALCGLPAMFVSAVDVRFAAAPFRGDPSSSPCMCGRQRCAVCAAEYTMREARHAA